LIRSVMDVESGDSLRVELRDGVLSCRVEKRVKRKA